MKARKIPLRLTRVQAHQVENYIESNRTKIIDNYNFFW